MDFKLKVVHAGGKVVYPVGLSADLQQNTAIAFRRRSKEIFPANGKLPRQGFSIKCYP